jgi:hypothetical protein
VRGLHPRLPDAVKDVGHVLRQRRFDSESNRCCYARIMLFLNVYITTL